MPSTVNLISQPSGSGLSFSSLEAKNKTQLTVSAGRYRLTRRGNTLRHTHPCVLGSSHCVVRVRWCTK